MQPCALNPEYGYLWWIHPGGFAKQGYLNTSVWVYPNDRLIVARMQKKA